MSDSADNEIAPGKLTLLRRILKAFAEAGDVAMLLENVTDDVVYKVSVAAGTPLSGEFHGKDGLARYFKEVAATVQHLAFHVSDILANDDTAVVIGDETLLIHKSGETFFTEWAAVARFRDAKICRMLIIENLGPLSTAYALPVTSSTD